MNTSITIAAAALLSAMTAGAAFAGPGDREYYPGASRDMNMGRGADAYGAPPAANYDNGPVDTMSTGSIYRDGGMQHRYSAGDGHVNKTYEPGAGDYYEGATAPR